MICKAGRLAPRKEEDGENLVAAQVELVGREPCIRPPRANAEQGVTHDSSAVQQLGRGQQLSSRLGGLVSIPGDTGMEKKKKISASKKAGGAARVHTVNKSNFTGGVGGICHSSPHTVTGNRLVLLQSHA